MVTFEQSDRRSDPNNIISRNDLTFVIVMPTQCIHNYHDSHSDWKTGGNLEKCRAIPGVEKSGNFSQNTRKVREFQTIFILEKWKEKWKKLSDRKVRKCGSGSVTHSSTLKKKKTLKILEMKTYWKFINPKKW